MAMTEIGNDSRTDMDGAQFQFMFPFKLKNNFNKKLMKSLLENGYEFFDLKKLEQEKRFYGQNQVSHRSLEKFFLPNIESILFPSSIEETECLRRFSKAIQLHCELTSKKIKTTFDIVSLDIIICPYQIGIMNIRVVLPRRLSLSDTLQFSDEFRAMEPIVEDQTHCIQYKDRSFTKVRDFIFHVLYLDISKYIDDDNQNSTYFGSLPFFMDERMFVISYISVDEDSLLTPTELFRIGHLYGYRDDGEPLIGANNPEYIKRYYEKHVYDRWADETYYVVSDYTFSCVTKSQNNKLQESLSNAMYGKHFYSILLYFFYKIALMKLTYEQSEIKINKDQERIEDLIVKITTFSSRYFSAEVNSSTHGKEIFQIVKSVYQIDYLYSYVKKTLETLYQNHEKLTSKRHSYLLQILTIYTVISGIYGMNLVIKDWEGEIKWRVIWSYSLFEWISFFVAISGIVVGIILGVYALKKWIVQYAKR
ncbi:hypothetical protein [Bacillus massiliigorillae]|uniref:hypothetical protein n=1 Tax=Bacillus massiliigorillae TaxID=1243664 RepID=UPI0003A7D250|nr:hypothetical protein [Bacillus massiliigorillae]